MSSSRLSSTALLTLAWLGVLAVALVQHAILGALHGGSAALGEGLRIYGPFVLAWGLVTPQVWHAARRWPVRGDDAQRNALRHAGLGFAFVLATNALFRLPMLAQGLDVFATDLATGLVWYGPFAMLAWAGLVAIGHVGPRTPAESGPLAIGAGPSVAVLDPDDIVWIEARDNYVRVHGTTGVRLVRCPISALDERLDPTRFVRAHRSAIIAVGAIREVRTATSGGRNVTLSNGATLRVPRARRADLDRVLAAYRAGPGRYSAAR